MPGFNWLDQLPVLGQMRRLQSQILGIVIDIQRRVQVMSDTLSAEITQLQTNVANLTTVDESAVALIQGFNQKLADAIAAASAAGATPDQLATLNSLNSAISAQTGTLAAAVAAGTTPAPPSA